MRCHAILIGLLLTLPLPAQQPQTTAHRAAETYKVSGMVVNALTGAALPHAGVHLQDVKGRAANRSAVTGEDGRFLFADVEVGKYALSAEKRGFPAQSYMEHEQYSTAIAVGPNLISENLIVSLTPAGEIFGFVTDDANEPVREARAELFKNEGINGTQTTHAAGTIITDDRGRYEFANLTHGAYFVAITAKPWYAQPQVLRGKGEAAQPGQNAAQNAEFDVAYPVYFYPNVTDAEEASPVPIKGGERVQVDFNLVPEHAMRVRIRVPEADPKVGISWSLTQTVFGNETHAPQLNNFQMIEPGIVEISGFPPGRYDLSLGQNDGKGERHTHLSLDARDGDLEDMGQAAQDEVAVTGKVILPNGGRAQPQAGMILHRQQPAHDYFAQLDKNDEFSFSVPAGTYQLGGQIQNAYIAQVLSQGAAIKGRNVKVQENHPVALTVMMGTGYGQIDGFVQRSAQGVGQGVSGAMVVLVPADPANNEILFRRDQSDSDGSFTLGGIVPGDYRLLALENAWDMEWRRPDVLAVFLAKSSAVRVRPGEHMNMNVTPQNAK